MKLIRPVIFMDSLGESNEGTVVKDFRPGHIGDNREETPQQHTVGAPYTPPVEAKEDGEDDGTQDPKASTAQGSASNSDAGTKPPSTSEDSTSNPNGSSGESEDPADAAKVKSQHPSMKPGKLTPPALAPQSASSSAE